MAEYLEKIDDRNTCSLSPPPSHLVGISLIKRRLINTHLESLYKNLDIFSVTMATKLPAPASRLPLLPATLFLVAAIAWPMLEIYTILGFDGCEQYSLSIESLSDLGVNYRQVHPLKHFPVTSWLHDYQNYNFQQAGILFGLAHLALLYITRHGVTSRTAPLRTIRVLLTVFYAAGMVLMGRIHGGPREQLWEIIGWHWTGLTLAAVAGNLNSIVAAVVPNQIGGFDRVPSYRALSALLGVFGLYSLYRFQTLGEWDFETHIGRWQRGSVYPVLLWEAVTAGNIIIAHRSGEFAKSKTL